MQKALIAGIAVAIICSFMGTFLVLRRYSLFGDGIAHVSFGGISIGLFLGVAPLWTAFVVAILGGLGLQKLRQSTKISGDAAVAVTLVSGLAIGVILISASGGFSADLFSFLFGSILLISLEDTALIIAISAGIVVILLALQKQFLHLTFNEEQAKIAGLNVTALNYVFVVLAAVTVVTSMRLVGILLISALIVIPNISAMMFGRGFKKTVGISITMSIFSVVTGIFLSYYLNLAPSGTIVIITVALLLGTLAARSAGLISKTSINIPSTISHNS
ncbi:MAG: zinc ABC transporter permease [Nitrosarchaeum sp.]|nr:metal ABC transporter permease [Nitrosarchaeum sp.]PHY10039.1 MAG: zinc ABC transporter permease [Nitrosarchaeum sp.]